MYTLYYKSGACSMAPHVLMNELNIPFEAKKVEAAEMKSPEFLKLNPRGQIPLLIIDGEPVKEGAAIMIYLLDTHDKDGKLMPKAGLPRAKALEWLAWCNASLHPACGKVFGLSRLTLDEKVKSELSKAYVAQVQSLWDEADARLGKTKYLAGDSLTVADILLSVIANWGLPVTLGTNVKRMIKEVSQRPAYQKALQTEQVEYKAAA
jgi:glutathione S-transferase